MRILVTADVHLDHGHWGATNPTTNRNDAWESAARCWGFACDTAIERGVDALVVPGDLFVNGRPTAEAIELVADGFRAVTAAGIRCVIADGNHEHIGVRARHRTITERFADIDGVEVFTQPGLAHLDTGTLAVLPWPRRSHIDGLGDIADAREADALVAAWAAERLAGLADAAANSVGDCVLVGHATVGEASIGTDRRGSEMLVHAVFSEPVLPAEILAGDDLPWSQVALGHIHRRQWIPDLPIHYVGSPDRVDFAEAGEVKAVSLIDTSRPAGEQVETIETPARVLADVDLAHPDQLAALEPGAIVRLTAAADTDRAEISQVRDALRDMGCRVARVVMTRAERDRKRRTIVAEDVSVLDGLTRWMDHHGVAGDERNSLITAATRLVERIDTTSGSVN